MMEIFAACGAYANYETSRVLDAITALAGKPDVAGRERMRIKIYGSV